jgi:hypothetical protein
VRKLIWIRNLRNAKRERSVKWAVRMRSRFTSRVRFWRDWTATTICFSQSWSRSTASRSTKW